MQKARNGKFLLRFVGVKTTTSKDFEFDERGALLGEVESLGGGVREVNDPVGRRWAAVVDGDADGFAVAEIGDAEFCAAGKFAVGGSELCGGVGATAGCFVAFERVTIEGSVTALGFGFGGRRFL